MAKLPVTYLLTFSESEVPNEIDSEWHELIRCKDCVHWHKGKNINYCRRFWDDDGEPKLYRCTADDYCSMAERKEE